MDAADGHLLRRTALQYITLLVLLAFSVGWAERAFGTLRTAGVFLAGHFFGALRTHGGSTISWMTTWPGNSYFVRPAGTVTFQRHSGVAVALGDPLCDPQDAAALVDDFSRSCQQTGLTPCFFAVTDATVAAAPPAPASR